MADTENQDQVHKDGTEHIKDKVFNEREEGQGTTTKPEPIVAAKPPASNPGADDPTAGIAKDAGGVSVTAHVGSPDMGNNEKKSIVGMLKDLVLGDDKKEREASEAGTATQGGTTTGAIAAGAAGTGVATGEAVAMTDKPKSDAAGESAPKSTTEQMKDTVMGGDKEANTGTAAATTAEPTESKQDTSDSKEETDTSGDSSHKPPAPAGGKTPENPSSIPTAGGERLGEKHWGESKIVPDNPKAAQEKAAESGQGVSSAEGQPTDEVKDNTAKNTGGATSGHKDEGEASGEKKGNFMDKIKDKLGKKDKE